MDCSCSCLTLCVHQALKTAAVMALVSFDAMRAIILFFFSSRSAPMVSSLMLSFLSSILPCSVSSWHCASRPTRLPMVSNQLSWISRISPTSVQASMMVPLRIWLFTPWSPSIMMRATSSAEPSSRAKRTREAADMTSWSWSAKCSKVLRTSAGIRLTTDSMKASSSFRANAAFSSCLMRTPCSSNRSSAAMVHFSRSHSLAKPEWMHR
mmetsp:Transcript_47971/g.148066  ORF Transcript_47971/g.148066 Transcript_47971/m.148066 type:complete len:209 (+) Transcript_47971:1045-1671(+)